MKSDFITLEELYNIIDLVIDNLETAIVDANNDPQKHDVYFVFKDTIIRRTLLYCKEITEDDEVKYSGMKHAVQYKLNHRNYYSIGSGMFVRLDAINSVAVLDLVIDNAKEDVEGRRKALRRKEQVRKDVIAGQMEMVFTSSNYLDKLQDESESKNVFLGKLEEYAI